MFTIEPGCKVPKLVSLRVWAMASKETRFPSILRTVRQVPLIANRSTRCKPDAGDQESQSEDWQNRCGGSKLCNGNFACTIPVNIKHSSNKRPALCTILGSKRKRGRNLGKKNGANLSGGGARAAYQVGVLKRSIILNPKTAPFPLILFQVPPQGRLTAWLWLPLPTITA